jgi:hypothetical protein
VFKTTRVETETEIAKWLGKPQDLDDYQVIPEVHTVRPLFTDIVPFFLSGRHLFSGQGRQMGIINPIIISLVVAEIKFASIIYIAG